jgi:hypothetical protein
MDDHDVISQAESDEEILTFDVSDAALERTASTERQAFTWIYCTGAWLPGLILRGCHNSSGSLAMLQ